MFISSLFILRAKQLFVSLQQSGFALPRPVRLPRVAKNANCPTAQMKGALRLDPDKLKSRGKLWPGYKKSSDLSTKRQPAEDSLRSQEVCKHPASLAECITRIGSF